MPDAPSPTSHEDQHFRALVLDGGGVRGVCEVTHLALLQSATYIYSAHPLCKQLASRKIALHINSQSDSNHADSNYQTV